MKPNSVSYILRCIVRNLFLPSIESGISCRSHDLSSVWIVLSLSGMTGLGSASSLQSVHATNTAINTQVSQGI
jgi:hypothetical protein